MELHTTLASRLGVVGQRYTVGRRALVEILADADRPLALHDILAEAPTLAQSSVYRNLNVLEQAGAVHRVHTSGDYARYELAEDLTEHHHHLVCTVCGDVSDVVIPARVERAVERASAEVASGAGFRLEGHRLDLVGRCADCA